MVEASEATPLACEATLAAREPCVKFVCFAFLPALRARRGRGGDLAARCSNGPYLEYSRYHPCALLDSYVLLQCRMCSTGSAFDVNLAASVHILTSFTQAELSRLGFIGLYGQTPLVCLSGMPANKLGRAILLHKPAFPRAGQAPFLALALALQTSY